MEMVPEKCLPLEERTIWLRRATLVRKLVWPNLQLDHVMYVSFFLSTFDPCQFHLNFHHHYKKPSGSMHYTRKKNAFCMSYTHWTGRAALCFFYRNHLFYYVVGMQDIHPLEPAEMAEHLKQGLGKEGQV